MRLFSILARLFAALLLLAPAAAAQRDSAFMKEFRELMKVHATDEMATLIKKNEEPAEFAVVEICNAIGTGSNDTLEAEIDALDKAWKKAFDEKFVEYYYAYVSVRLTGQLRRSRNEVRDKFLVVKASFDEAYAAKDASKIPGLALELRALGDNFGDVGDHYYESRCFAAFAAAFEENAVGDKADLRRVCEGWRLFLESSDEMDRKGKMYDQAKARFQALEYDGYGDPTKGPEARAAAKAEADPSYAAAPLGGTFELVEDIDAIQRPMYTADSVYQAWPAVFLAKEGSTGKLPALREGFNLLRTGAAKAAVDYDQDGTGDVEIPLTGKLTAVTADVEQGGVKRPWGFLTCIGQQADTYQGFRFNMAPTENYLSIYIAPAASLVGMVGETRIQVFDDNMDGVYGSAPLEWSYTGLTDGALQRDVDSILVGEGKVARPWSRLQEIGGVWYDLAPTEDGSDILVKRADVQTGILQLSFKGPKPAWLIVRGTGKNEDLFYDVVNGGKNEIDVPIGSYSLFVGQVATGKRDQLTKALILPPKSPPAYQVTAGSKTRIEMGAPFGFQFKCSQDDKTVTVEGPTVVITGRGTEIYQRFWNCVPQVEVNVRKEGAKKGKKEGKMIPVTSQELLQTLQNDYRLVWFPHGEPLEKPKEGEKVEVQLYEKKNKLFGKIESEWRAD
jgi:hypothetical protein